MYRQNYKLYIKNIENILIYVYLRIVYYIQIMSSTYDYNKKKKI